MHQSCVKYQQWQRVARQSMRKLLRRASWNVEYMTGSRSCRRLGPGLGVVGLRDLDAISISSSSMASHLRCTIYAPAPLLPSGICLAASSSARSMVVDRLLYEIYCSQCLAPLALFPQSFGHT